MLDWYSLFGCHSLTEPYDKTRLANYFQQV